MTDTMPTRSDAVVPRVLIADDQPDVLEALRLSFITSATKQPTIANAASGRNTCQIGISPRSAPAKLDCG